MAVPLELMPLDGEPVRFSHEEVKQCGVLVRSGAEEPGERVPVALQRDDLLAWQRGLSSDSTPTLDIVAALKVWIQPLSEDLRLLCSPLLHLRTARECQTSQLRMVARLAKLSLVVL